MFGLYCCNILHYRDFFYLLLHILSKPVGICLNYEKVTLFVKPISDFVVLLCKLRVDVLFRFDLFLVLLDLAQFFLHLLIVIFQKTLLECLNSIFKSFQLGKDSSFSCKDFCLLNIIFGNSFFEQSLCLFDLLKCSFVILQLYVCCCLVVIVKRLVGIEFNCLLIEVQSFIEIFLLKKVISFILQILSGIFNLHLLRFLLFCFGWRWGRCIVFFFLLLRLTWLLCEFLLIELFCKVFKIIWT